MSKSQPELAGGVCWGGGGTVPVRRAIMGRSTGCRSYWGKCGGECPQIEFRVRVTVKMNEAGEKRHMQNGRHLVNL